MRVRMGMLCASCLLAAHLTATASAGEPGASWQVSKVSGDVWISTGAAQRVSLSNADPVTPGQTVRTGGTGMVLLTRGQESMFVSPNSVIEIPKDNRDGMSTTIVEKAGSVLLEVEKRNVQHFEVVTPYLAAVVKGTHFRVSVDQVGSQVQVLRGQVDVSDFHSGEQVLLLPSQEASVAASGGALAVSGSGLFNPVRVGPPRPQPFAPEQPNIKSAALDQPAAAPAAGAAASKAAASVAPAAPQQLAQAQAAPMPGARTRPWLQADNDDVRKEPTQHIDTLTLLTVPASLGLLVSFAVAVGRGLKRRGKKDQGDSRR